MDKNNPNQKQLESIVWPTPGGQGKGQGQGQGRPIPITTSSSLTIDFPSDVRPFAIDIGPDLDDNCHESNLLQDKEKGGTSPRSWLWRYRGYFYALLSSLICSFTAQIVKYSYGYTPVTMAMWGFQGSLVPAVPFTLFAYTLKRCSDNKTKRSLSTVRNSGSESDCEKVDSDTDKGDRDDREKNQSQQRKSWQWQYLKVGGFLLLRSVMTCTALLLNFYSLQKLGLGEASVISALAPIFTYFFAHYFLNEPCGIVPVFTCLSAFLGVAVIVRPAHFSGEVGLDNDTLIGLGMALGSIILTTLSFVTLRYIRRVHYTVITLFFGTWGTIETIILSLILGALSLPHDKEDWLLAGLMASLTLFGQFAIINALRAEASGPVSLIRTFDVLFGILWKSIFWGVAPDALSMFGASIVILGIILTALRKWLGFLSEDHKIRQRLRILLV